jgi:hypothetical protein
LIEEDGAYKITDMEAFSEDFRKLREKHDMDEYDKEEVNVRLHTVTADMVPLVITDQAYQIISVFVETE